MYGLIKPLLFQLDAERAQQRVRFRRLDAFGAHLQPQPVCHRQDLAHQEVVAALERPDEGLVDLEHIRGDAAQIAQVREPRSKVVDGDAYARLADTFELPRRALLVGRERPLGELDLDVLGF